MDSTPISEHLLIRVNCPACGKLIAINFSYGYCYDCKKPFPKKLLEEVGFDFTRLQEPPTPEINMDTQDNWADRSTPTTQISKSLTPTSTRHIPTGNPTSPQTSNPDVTMISPSSQIQKTPQNDFQIVSPKKAAKKPRTEENFKINTENSYSHLQEESDRPPKSIATISLVIKENFNLILQDITRRYPEIENHFQRAHLFMLSGFNVKCKVFSC
ncbi:hypothetical protein HNY73_009706 [Argiope bruennichi]|uniref:Uncharacterized protein n=1 Tax=Argiope bruennichi TaxID=94029 RepID=A0A8T0FCU5_ARGBR|nr:hypothetical protein HNY73_009706 [Argiope bruennichi]